MYISILFTLILNDIKTYVLFAIISYCIFYTENMIPVHIESYADEYFFLLCCFFSALKVIFFICTPEENLCPYIQKIIPIHKI